MGLNGLLGSNDGFSSNFGGVAAAGGMDDCICYTCYNWWYCFILCCLYKAK